jgi:serine/threonine protein kinase
MPLSLDDFRRELVACGLMTSQELEDLVAGLTADRPVQTASDLARELVRLRKLTTYQVQEVARGQGQKLRLGNYLILDKIGQGGMGLVLKAEHRRMRRVVALKVLHARALASEAAVRRFHREVQAAARLIHPNIVTAFDADEYRGVHFLVMEYVEGTDLSTLVKLQGPLPLARALDYVVQAATGLAHAHQRGIVHRDIKPRNLLLSRDGIVKILDMGLARIDTSTPAGAAELTGSGQIMGTVDYMAPEQAVHPEQADERADIYSLGATLWYLVTGQHLYPGQTVLEKLIAHREQPIPSLGERVLGASPNLDDVLRKMLAKKPHKRYASMREVIAALQGCRVPADSAVTVLIDPPHAGPQGSAARGVPAAAAAHPRTGVPHTADALEDESHGSGWHFLGTEVPSQPQSPVTDLETLAESPSASDTSRTGALAFPLVAATFPAALREPSRSGPCLLRGRKARRVWPREVGGWFWVGVLLLLALAGWLWLRGFSAIGRRPRSTAGVPPAGVMAHALLVRMPRGNQAGRHGQPRRDGLPGGGYNEGGKVRTSCRFGGAAMAWRGAQDRTRPVPWQTPTGRVAFSNGALTARERCLSPYPCTKSVQNFRNWRTRPTAWPT